MAIAIFPKRWTRKPIGAVRPDFGHPLLPLEAWLCNEGSGPPGAVGTNGIKAGAVVGSPGWSGEPSLTGFATTPSYYKSTDSFNSNLGNNFSICARVFCTNVAARNSIYSTGTTSSNGQWLEVGNFTGSSRTVLMALPGTAVVHSANDTIPPANHWVTLAAVKPGSGVASRLYINGAETTYQAQLTTDFTDTTDNKYIGIRASANSQPFNGRIEYVYVYRRALSPTEIMWIYQEPYAFMQPMTQRSYFNAASASFTPRLPLLGVG